MKTIVLAPTSKEPTAIELKNRELSRKAAREGFVLLENNGILPLRDKDIALYGAGARMTVKGGRGSGEVRNRYSVSIEDGLKARGYNILTSSWLDDFDKFYADTYEAYRVEMEKRVEGLRSFTDIQHAMIPFQHPTGMPVEERHLVSTDTAIYVLARQAGEGHDREFVEGDYKLTQVELEGLRTVRKAYRNLIVVINVGGLLDLSFLDEMKVEGLVYFTQGGEEGGNALADVLSGDYPFVGKMATSWPYSYTDLPSSRNYSYLSPDKYTQDYNEGIFIGYRYFDTFGAKCRYPFGYGLGYTSFSMKMEEVELSMDNVTVRVSVENTGSAEGKEVVQLYASVPDVSSEKKRLVAFSKTPLLKGGETSLQKLSFSMKDIAVYDEKRSSWVLPEGEYLLSLGSSSDAVSPCAVLVTQKEHILEKCTAICPLQKELEVLQAPEKKAEDTAYLARFILDSVVPETVVHTYETPEVEVDPLIADLTDEELVTLVMGPSTQATKLTVAALGASGNTTGELYETRGIPSIVLSDGPAGLNLSAWIVQVEDGTVKGARVPENIEAYKRYLFGFNRTIMLARMALPEEGTMHYQYCTAWPCSQLLAQTFSPELLEEVGKGVGDEMEMYGVTVWLAPGMNIHRNPLCGRTFEYYSEDPLVAGKMAAAIVRGVQSHPGKGMSIKHFVGNNCELVRNWSSSNMNEKTLREIYLRGFEIAVKESDPMTVMASYNKINGLHVVNNYDLLGKVLRNEWDFKGAVISDWDSMKADRETPTIPKTGDVQKAHKAQLDLVCPGRPDQKVALMDGLEKGVVSRHDLERAGTRLLRMIRKNTVVESK